MVYRVAIDVGGTFTDFLLLDSESNRRIFKVPTSPSDPSQGIFNGLELMAKAKGLTIDNFLSNVDVIVHGTTITTNAVLTGNGARTGFVTTKGFRDVLNMRRGLKENQYETKQGPPPPLVPRYLIQTVKERVDCEGKELLSVDYDDVIKAVNVFTQEDVEAIGISFLFSFFNSLHEEQVKDILESKMPGVYVSCSSEILPQIRFYERSSTVVLNAYLGPILKRYLQNLLERLGSSNFQGTLLIMQSNGGVMSPEVAMRFAANTILSGPAVGPTAGLYYASTYALKNIITIDMGGTSFDACLIKDSKPNVTTEASINGHRLSLPVIDMHTIGAGGGSIAWIDSGGILKVGPQSAGADPGPACYDKGGEKPTVTDANLVLGYLDIDYFYAGGMKLNYKAAVEAIEGKIAHPLGMNVVDAAYGIYHIVNAKMAAELRVISVARGYDPREFAIIVAGGAGPLHAGMIARELEIPLIIVPKESSVFCAAGMLMSDLRHDYVKTYTSSFNYVNFEEINSLFKQMEKDAMETLKQERVPQDKIVLEYSADIRYEGQFNEVEVPIKTVAGQVDMDVLLETLRIFHDKHESLYGYSMPGAPAKIINLRLSARGVTKKPSFKPSTFKGEDPAGALKKYRQAFFGRQFIEVPVYNGLKMGYGNRLNGPAIIEEPTTTILVPPEYSLVCDHQDNYLIHPKDQKVEDLITALRRYS